MTRLRMPRRGFRALAAAVALVTGAVLLAGCTNQPEAKLPTQTSTPVVSPTSATPTADELAVQRFYTQRLVWKDCSGGFQCATAQAPIDWAHPAQGAPIHLALIRKPATSGHALGSLFVNPGGPGESGVDFVRQAVGDASPTLQANYDIVGWDPRGVGASSAVKCYDDAGLDQWLYGIVPGVRGSTQWLDASKQITTSLGAACLKNTGPLLGHIDTPSTAHDLDMLRGAVGDAKLNYLGFSYGTLIGAIYADMFPSHVGRMALDGVVDPASTYDDVTQLQAVGFEDNLKAYAQWCVTSDRTCPFHGSADAAMNAIGALLQQVDRHPIKNSDGRLLGSATLQTAIILPLYNQSNWPSLDVLFKDVDKGSARVAFLLADQYNERDSNGRYASNVMVAFAATNCLDYEFDDDLAHMQAQAAALAKAAPVMGPFFSYGGIACAGWPFGTVRVPAPVRAAGSAPILVLGTTNDPATPYSQSVALAKELENGHLVTWRGNGHTAYGRSNTCVLNTVDDYFVKGTVPARDPEC
ncbi:MAG: alpha/beta hydrolase [Microbacteriaceae bacterium]|nr:alpha/beta hydrolase [Microbacteriaceae bacterium]MCL2794462.1 alpha/beta hydrolase [Microbacteriaceae bacterium]